MSGLRLGVDVGGTNTDAVVVDSSGTVLAATKAATTPEPIGGIQSAVAAVLAQVDDPAGLDKAMLGTTHPTNAIIRRQDLDRVGVLRLAAPSSLGVRPQRSLARGPSRHCHRSQRDRVGRVRVRRHARSLP